MINNETGWLVSDSRELIKLAVKLWISDYDESMRIKARDRAMVFSVTRIINEWLVIINGLIHDELEDKNNKEPTY
ncbi:hypothetical protein [Vulcanisaeta distributa]|uniref:hypothetical protein n=1 Tax=Vulcanisaeta distributa TaxID=164451 RepID=UPI000AEC7DCE|nr:hypothetical protein [Vulcanisaeta distributa]